eukprot:8450492-Pyramimonas_sp.AAC.1
MLLDERDEGVADRVERRGHDNPVPLQQLYHAVRRAVPLTVRKGAKRGRPRPINDATATRTPTERNAQ